MTVLVIMGVSGSGKSTIARLLAARLGWDLQEGDDLHPQANVEKMAAGVPLTDEDRRPWLDRVAAWIRAHTSTARPGIVTCSALRRSYRDQLRGRADFDAVVFVYLAGSRDRIAERLAARKDHFMPPGLLDSQLDLLEPPAADEKVLRVDAVGSPDEIADEVITRLASLPRSM